MRVSWLTSETLFTLSVPDKAAYDLILKPAAWPARLGEEPTDAPKLKARLAPYPSEEMVAWPVSPRIGNVKNNDPSLIEPIAYAG